MIRWSGPGDLPLPAPLRDHAVEREPIGAGASTAQLERLRFADGRTLVAKEVNPDCDWMMRMTRDTGRAATLWVSGVMERCPAVIDPALVRIEDGWRLYMREVVFHPRGTRFSRSDVGRLLDHLAALHDAFWDETVPGLCSLHDLLTLLSPRTVEAAAGNPDFLRAVQRGWEVFADVVAPEVAEAVFRLLDDPTPLVESLESQGTTLIHADAHLGNAVLLPDRLVLVDWTLACQAPPTVELTWFLDQSAHLLDATHDEVVAEFLRAEEGRVEDAMLDVACLGELLNAGWQCVEWIDRDDRAVRQASLDWFVSRALRALSQISPR